MEGAELIKYAKDKASEGVDLFVLLGIDATTSPDDIHKAWRRTALKHHPDKAGANYNAELYESFGRARDVLIDPEARAAYNKVVSAALQKKAQLEQMSSRRRQLVEDLERREAEARGAKRARTDQQSMHDPERAAMAARGRAKMEERKRLIREAEEREKLREREQQEQQKQFEMENPSAAAPAETETPAQEPATAATAQTTQPPSQANGEPHGDDYDDRIADLERRIRERKEKKLRRKEEKKAGKTGATMQPEEAPENPPAPIDPDDGPKADAPSSRPASDIPPSSVGGSGGSSSSNGGTGGNPFASTMARLRAAQAQREEEKRRRAAAEPAST